MEEWAYGLTDHSPPLSGFISRSKSKALVQNQLLMPSLQVAFAMCNEFPEDEEEEGDDDDDDGMYLPAHEFGAQMIDHFALTLSAKKVPSAHLSLSLSLSCTALMPRFHVLV
jgi:hypothetical protein